MWTQQPPTPARVDNLHALSFIYGVQEEITTDAPADILQESPPSTIPFDKDSPPLQLSSEPLPPIQEVGHVASSSSLTDEFSTLEENGLTHRPNHAISEPLLRKRKREDVDGVDFWSKKQLIKEVPEPYQTLEKEKRQWQKDKEILEVQIQFFQRHLTSATTQYFEQL